MAHQYDRHLENLLCRHISAEYEISDCDKMLYADSKQIRTITKIHIPKPTTHKLGLGYSATEKIAGIGYSIQRRV